MKSEELPSFYEKYSKILRTSLTQSLIPKKSKKSTPSTTQKPKKKFNSLKPFQGLPYVCGPKRGSKVEKRRKLVKDRMKMIYLIRKRQVSKVAQSTIATTTTT